MESVVVQGTLIAPRRAGQSWLVKITCPFCHEIHKHGAGTDGTLLGSRSPHCRKPEDYQRGKYTIVVSESTQ